MKKTAVITDATSPDFFFPRWQDYYGRLFGPENLHVITYSGMKNLFLKAGVGNIWEVNATYNDALRAALISDFVTVLLNSYDVVLRCDVDEFLAPDPQKFTSLASYVEDNPLPYVTAHGVDVIELESDPPLAAGVPVLQQRRFGLRSTPLNKTSLTTVPMRWAAGFHAASVPPCFCGLYIFHLKFAEIKTRIAWHAQMLEGLSPGTSEHNYFSFNAEQLLIHKKFLSGKAKTSQQSQTQFDLDFLESVTYNAEHHIYQGKFTSQDDLFEIDPDFGKKTCFKGGSMILHRGKIHG